MARTTTELRKLWAPPCEGPWARMSLYGGGVVSVDPLIVEAVRALNAALIEASYETRRADTGAYNCRRITGGTGYSLHAFGIAIDVNWNSNPYGSTLRTDMPLSMIEAIERIRTKGGATVWRWGGRYKGNKDAMHFEVVASPAELAKGIDPATIPGGAKPPRPDTEEAELAAAKDEIQKSIETARNDVIAFVLAALIGNGKGSKGRIAEIAEAQGLREIAAERGWLVGDEKDDDDGVLDRVVRARVAEALEPIEAKLDQLLARLPES